MSNTGEPTIKYKNNFIKLPTECQFTLKMIILTLITMINSCTSET